MDRYEGCSCLVCEQDFNKGDDVVVCPICGTPHHRDCWKKNGCCVNKDKHADGYEWQDEITSLEDDDYIAIAESIRKGSGADDKNTPSARVNRIDKTRECPHCHEETQANMPFCLKCGGSLMDGSESLCPRCGNLNDKSASFCSRCGMVLPQGQTFSVPDKDGKTYIRPLDEADGVSAAEMASYVQVNSQRYIPRFFKMIKENKKISWNWGSFFLSPYWFFFRKMYSVGFIMFGIMLVMNLIIMPQMQPMMEAYAQYVEVLTAAASTSADIAAAEAVFTPLMTDAMPLMYVYLGVTALLHVFCGLFSDYIYKKQMLRSIKDWKQKDDPASYQIRLLRNGGVSPMMAAASLFILPALVNVCMMFIEML